MKKTLTVIIIVVVLIGIGIVITRSSAPKGTPIAQATYMCSGSKTITATYYQGAAQPGGGPNMPPAPGGSVHLVLSDGRTMDLAQTLSADGARYSNGNPQTQGSETFVFWNKGNGATVTENGNNQTFSGCIAVAKDPGTLPNVYENGTEGFSIRYPQGYTVNDQYQYQELGPGKSIGGVSFTIASTTATGTNLSGDTHLAVEEIPQSSSCGAAMFLPAGTPTISTTTRVAGLLWSVASSTGAAAGNRYEETVYAIPGTNPCIGVRYYIHYGVLQNYPQGSVQEFDKQSLLDTFDAMRKTLTIAQ